VPGGDIGTPRLPNRVVSYLQAHPETKYVTMAFGSMAIGLPQALAAAGLTDKVTVISEAGGPINFQYIKSGQQTMDLAQDLRVQAWTGVDAAARLATGQKTTLVDPLPPIRFLTKDNITFDPQGGFTAFPDYKEHFRKQWGITT
jgi:ribose transport system substrate-binding protein